MPDSTSHDDGSSAAQEESQRDTIADRRKRLAQMIGGLLARKWLCQSPVAEKDGSPHGRS